MCNYDVLKCLIDFAMANKADSFKKYINSVNVKVSVDLFSILSNFAGVKTLLICTFSIPGGVCLALPFNPTTKSQQTKCKQYLLFTATF